MRGLIHTCTFRHVGGYKQALTFSGPTGTAVVGQTVTGGTSHATGIVDTVANPLVIKTVTGTFTPGEALSTASWSATLTTQADYQDEFGGSVPDTSDTASVACRFYQSDDTVNVSGQAVSIESALLVMLPTTVTPVAGDFIITTDTGFIGTWMIDKVMPHPGAAVMHHWTCKLSKGGA